MQVVAHIKPVMKEILDFIEPLDLMHLETTNRIFYKCAQTTASEILIHVSMRLYKFNSIEEAVFYMKFITSRV